MAIKDLLVAYDGHEASEKALEFALRMGTKYGAAVSGIYVMPKETYDTRIRHWLSADVQEGLAAARREAAQSIVVKFNEHVAKSGFTGTTGFLMEEGQADLTLARAARFFDVLLIGQFITAFKSENRTVDPAELLLRAGKPVLIVPRDYVVRPFKEEAAIAWDGSRYAARALTDAMQILETKKKLDVLTVVNDPHADAGAHANMPGLDIIVHLSRHGINAEHVAVDASHVAVGKALLDHCARTDPDVLVMGAYGRGTFGAQLFGGVTRYILEHQNVPVLLSH